MAGLDYERDAMLRAGFFPAKVGTWRISIFISIFISILLQHPFLTCEKQFLYFNSEPLILNEAENQLTPQRRNYEQ